jgi:hypothetical protein
VGKIGWVWRALNGGWNMRCVGSTCDGFNRLMQVLTLRHILF